MRARARGLNDDTLGNPHLPSLLSRAGEMTIAEGVNPSLHVISVHRPNGTRDTFMSATCRLKGSLGGSRGLKVDTLGNRHLPSLESKQGR